MQTNYRDDLNLRALLEEHLTNEDVLRRTRENLEDERVKSFTVYTGNRHERRASAAQERKRRKKER